MLLSPRWFLPLSLIVKHVRILLFTYDVPLAVTPLRMHIFAHVSSKANDRTRAHL
jgi:hypothetical protein